jgi:hypothetical protein
VGGGVTVLVAVVPALSFAAEHEASNTTIIVSANDNKVTLRNWPMLYPPENDLSELDNFEQSVL